jgi:hypothetical protein
MTFVTESRYVNGLRHDLFYVLDSSSKKVYERSYINASLEMMIEGYFKEAGVLEYTTTTTYFNTTETGY